MLTRQKVSLKNVIQRLEQQYKKGFQQVEVLNERYLDLVSRYKRALLDRQMSTSYSLYLRIQVIEEVRLAYYEFTKQKAAVLTRIREEMHDDYYDVIQDEMEDDSMLNSRE